MGNPMTREDLNKMIVELDTVSVFLTQAVSGIAHLSKILADIQGTLKDVLKDLDNVSFIRPLRLIKTQTDVISTEVKKHGWPKGKPRGKRKMEVTL
jgi:hypothetical protein